MRLLALTALTVTVALLSGCALTPKELQEQGVPVRAASSAPPARVASCMAGNIQEISTAWVPRSRETDPPGRIELVASVGGGRGTLGIFHLDPTASGTTITGWLLPGIFGGSTETFDKFMKGC